MARLTVGGSLRNPVRGAFPVGELDSATTISVTFWLPTSVPGLMSEADRIAETPIGERTYYTREELWEKYPPDQETFDAVYAFARKYDLDVVGHSKDRHLINLAVPISAVTDLFGTQLLLYKDARGRIFRGRTGTISLNADDFTSEQVSNIGGVFGLDNRWQARKMFVSHSDRRLNAEVWSAPERLYGISDGNLGDGNCVGILEFGGPLSDSDLTWIFGSKNYGSACIVTTSPFEPGSKISASLRQEAMVDSQVINQFTPNARKVIYVQPNTEQGWVTGLNFILCDSGNVPSVLSISWGAFEAADSLGTVLNWSRSCLEALEDHLARATLLGISACCSSGDDGIGGVAPTGPQVCYPASSRFVLAVGGTEPYGGSERVWASDSCASGGGISNVFALPDWQKDAMIKPSSSTTLRPPNALLGRMIPDVAALAQRSIQGIGGLFSGTSASAPLWTCLLIKANQQIREAGINKTVGNITTLFYDISSNLQEACNDISIGSNGIPVSSKYCYIASRGWDACTGWGSPNASKVLAALLSNASSRKTGDKSAS